MTDLPQPLTPAACDLRGLPYMPLDVIRLLDSDMFAESTGDELKAAIALWCKSWTQIPAGSLPNKDKVLAELSRAKNWKKVKAMAMRGWILCADDRWYHPVVAEKALAALPGRAEFNDKKSAEAERKERERNDRKVLFELLKSHGHNLDWNTSTKTLRAMSVQYQTQECHADDCDQSRDMSQLVTVSKGEVREREVEGREKGERRELKPNPEQQPLCDDLPVAPPKLKKTKVQKPAEPGTGKAWAAYATAYWQLYNVEPVRNAMVNGQLSQLVKRIGATDAEHVAAFFVGHKHRFYVEKMHPVGLLLADCEKLRTEWATSTQMTATRAQQQDRTQTNLDAFAPLLAEAEARERAKREAAHASE